MPAFFRFFFIAVLSTTLASFAFGAKIEVINADKYVQAIRSRILKVKTFSGSFVYVFNNKTYSGEIFFKYPNKFLMVYFGQSAKGDVLETGQKFVSDGKSLWLVFKNQNIAINETLERGSSPLIGWNINRLLKEYVATLPKSDAKNKVKGTPESYLVNYRNAIAYKILFVPKSNTAGFKFMSMIINEAGDILKVESQNQLGASIELAINYRTFNEPISDQKFEYEPDENTQIYENILLSREEKDNE